MYVLLKIKQVTFLKTTMSLCKYTEKAVRYVNRGYMSKEGQQVMLLSSLSLPIMCILKQRTYITYNCKSQYMEIKYEKCCYVSNKNNLCYQ